MILGIAIPRAASLDHTWTTVSIATAALQRGHKVRFIEPWDFEVDGKGALTARAHAFDAPLDAHAMVHDLRRRTAKRTYVRLDTLSVLLIRAAPFDMSMMAFAAMAGERGVEVVNSPEGLLRVSHKAWLAGLPDVASPTTLVTQSPGTAQLFYEKHRTAVIVKPARGSGGRDVHFVKRRDTRGFETAFARARGRGTHVVVQTYLQEAEQGEKRVVWMDGEVLGGYLRQRAPGEFRHNLKQGGTAVPTEITHDERQVLDALTPHLLGAGIRLAGIDMIGPYVIEVNALNPGGAYHADRLHGSDISGTIVQRLEGTGTREA